jgi:uncharacterized protein (TIGR02271 family)
MADAEDRYARHVKLADSDRELEDGEPDIRGWPVEDGAGNRAGTVDDLLLNTETEIVDAIALDNGERYPIDEVEIGDERVYLLSAVGDAGTAVADEEELRVQRSEEELRAGTREREAGRIKVRKKVQTEREQVRVPKRREEVNVERVPVEGEAGEAEIGEDEVSVPVVEEEVVVEKRPVVKEEVRVKKDVVQDEEVVEEDVRKEEVDIDDQARRNG